MRVKKSNKSSISVSLQELPQDINTFTNIVRNTYRDCRIQRNQIERVTLNNKMMQKFLNDGYVIVSNLEQVESKMDYEFLYNYKHDFYLKSTNSKSIISIENLNSILFISKSINLEVWANNLKFYNHYNLEEKDELDNLYVGDSIRLVIDKKNNSLTINYDFKNVKTFNNYINDLSFLDNVIESRQIVFKDSIKNKEFILPLCESENIEEALNSKMLKEKLAYLNEVKDTFDLLGLNNDEEFKVDNLTEADENNIRFLVNNVIYNRMYNPKSNDDISPFSLVNIGNISFLIYAEKQSKGYKFLNPATHRFNVFMRYEDERPDRKVSPYFCLKDIEISKISNFDYDDIYYSFVNVKNSEDINMFIIRLIEAYDISNKKKLLDLANRLADWVINNEIDNELWHCVKLNKIQSNLRVNDKLSIEDIDYLNSVIYNDSYELNLKLGASLLLKNKCKFDCYFNKLSKSSKAEFIKYPIYKKFYTYVSD